MTEALGVIIGRKGSKGVPGKNARLIAGKPAVAWTIEHAQAARLLNRFVVSTDCPEVTRAATAGGVKVVPRPTELASDTATVDAAARQAVQALGDEAAIVVLLYANVPVRPAGLIDRAIRTLEETGADSVQSYAPVGKHHPLWMMRLDEEGRLSPYEHSTIYRRQDLPPVYLPDGGVIAVRRASLGRVEPEQPHAFLGSDRRGIINNEGDVVDIDHPIDLAVAEALLRQQGAEALT
ncbi:MAG: cytidylyltransferase domain-containing protein [Phycisphaerales bacterium JB038]